MLSIERTVSFETSTTSNGNNGGRRWDKSLYGIVCSYINLINLIFVCVVAIYMTFLCYHDGNRPITWHVWLCTIGYQVLMTQAILSFYPFNVITQPYSRKTRKTIHWILEATGSIAALTGMIIEYVSRSQSSKPHFSTTHSTIGLIAGIFTLIGMLNGISALWAVELRTYTKPIYLKFLHNLTGISAFTIGMIALYFGYDKGYMKSRSRDDIRMWLQILAIITILLSLIGALRSLYRQFRATFSL